MLKYTLIPEGYFSAGSAAELLSKVVILEKTDSVKSMELPSYKAVLLYAGDDADARRISGMLASSAALECYNKVVVSLGENSVDIVLAAGDRLLLCNSFPAADPVTAQYFLFAALRQFQINPEVTTVHFYGEAGDDIKGDLFRHFASVEVL
ncbi:MAG: DUF3822 family protein [Bacteroidales bacterium]|nr:DUF3822 family protein [Bacteroidales bacterium]